MQLDSPSRQISCLHAIVEYLCFSLLRKSHLTVSVYLHTPYSSTVCAILRYTNHLFWFGRVFVIVGDSEDDAKMVTRGIRNPFYATTAGTKERRSCKLGAKDSSEMLKSKFTFRLTQTCLIGGAVLGFYPALTW